MADIQLKDAGLTTITKGHDVLRLRAVTDLGAALSGTDAIGGTGGTDEHEFPYKKTSTFRDMAELENVQNEAGDQIGLIHGPRTVELEGEFMGQTTLLIEQLIMSIRHTVPGYWQILDYEKTQAASAAFNYVRREFFIGIFEPNLESVRQAGELIVVPFKISFIEKPSATSAQIGGKYYIRTLATSIAALGSEVWT